MKHVAAHIRPLAGIAAAIGLFALPAFAFASVSVSIQNVSPSNNITVGQGVTFNITTSGFLNPTYAVSDSFNGSSVSSSDIDSSGDFSWTPGNGDVGNHTLTITVSDSLGNSETSAETITVSAPASISLQSLSPGSNVVVGQTVTFVASVTGFTNPSYSVSDSFGGSSVSNADINSSGDFSWTPAGISQNGVHTITVYVTDSLGHTVSATETINVQATPTVTIGTVSPSTNVTPGQTVSFTANASNFSSPSFSLSDSFGGSSINNSYINSSGQFTWVPTAQDDGTHTITVYVNDSQGHSATASQTIDVGGTAVNSGGTIQGFTSGTDILVGQPVTFTVDANGFTNPVFSIGDSFGGGSSVRSADINSAGYFTWTPQNIDIGTHNLTIYINDSSGHTGNVTVSIPVVQPNVAVTSIEPGTSVPAGSLLSFLVSAAGFSSPNYTVSDSFSGSTLSDSDINSSGDLDWTPDQTQIGTHTITVYATDSEGHSANTSITIDVVSQTSVIVPTTTTSTSALGQLEAELQQDEAAIQAAGGATGGPSTSYVFTENMSLGMSDAQVTQLQTVLENKGYFSGTVTGYYGSLTETAVMKFQAANGIEQLGIVGPATRAALNALMVTQSSSASSSSSASTAVGDGYVFTNFIGYGDTSNDVTELQKRLTAFGVYSGPITGYFGSLTQTAVETFQGQHGIQQVGYVGPSTRAALDQ